MNAVQHALYDFAQFEINTCACRWCIRPGCTQAIRCKSGARNDKCMHAKCTCGAVFCFNCAADVHSKLLALVLLALVCPCLSSFHAAPATCSEVRNWRSQSKEQSETAMWLNANTKDCPKCKAAIEKNMGCNVSARVHVCYEWQSAHEMMTICILMVVMQHMTCRNCSHQFW